MEREREALGVRLLVIEGEAEIERLTELLKLVVGVVEF
jgi:hypothetical protein